MHPTHQISDSSKYYMRFEREAKEMSRGIVRAMFSRRQAAVHHPVGCLARPLSNNLKQIK